MAAPLDDDVKKQIYAMFSKHISTKVIADKTGVSESTVKRLRKSWKNLPAHAGAHARVIEGEGQLVEPVEPNKGQQGQPKVQPKGQPEGQEMDRDKMAQTARETMAFVVQRAKEGFLRASLEQDVNKRTWQEVQYLKILSTVTKQAGTWGGLDQMTTNENRLLSDYGQALAEMKADLDKVEDWETMP